MTAKPMGPRGGFLWSQMPKPPKPGPEPVPEPPRPTEVECLVCGETFQQTQAVQLYCSKKHKAAAYRARNKMAKQVSKLRADPPKDVTPAMVTAAMRAADAANIQDPYGARISDFIGADGKLDKDGLRAADAEAEAKNVEAWTAVLRAAITARTQEQLLANYDAG